MTDEQIKYSLENCKLKLDKWNKFTHYEIVGFCFLIPIVLVFYHIKDYFLDSNKPFNPIEIWFFIIPTLFGIIFYFIQKNRLKFKRVQTSLKRDELNQIIENVAKELKWNIITQNENIVIAKTHPRLLSGSWGERITILFDNNLIFVNSICDPEKTSSLVSMGRNSNNEDKLIKELNKASR